MDLEKTVISSRRQKSEFHSLSTDENVQIIVDDWSGKERDSVEESDKWISLTFGSAALSETFSNADIENRDI